MQVITAVLAVLPILTILVLMIGLRWPASRAGLTGLAVAVVVALARFDFPAALGADLGVVQAGAGTAAEALFTALTILWIIGPALGIYALQVSTGGTEVLRTGFSRLTDDPRILALLVGWFFALFMEGAAGFGTAVALTAPFLVAAGFSRLEAVVVPMIGHCVGVAFGAVGTPVVPQIAVTGLTGLEISRATGLYASLLGWIPLVAAMHVATRATPGPGGSRRIWLWTAAAGAAFLVPFALLARFVGPELPTLAGALFGGALFVAVLVAVGRRRVRSGSTQRAQPGTDPGDQRDAGRAEQQDAGAAALLRAASPYLALVALVLVTRLVPPVREALQGVEVGWELFGVFSGTVQPLYNPGTMLLAGFLVGAAAQRVPGRQVLAAVADATRRLLPVTVALVAMLGLSRVMVNAGMIEVLAVAAAAGTGVAWPLFAPLVGTLGTFVTGSATASNILFTDFQAATAETLDLPVAPLVGVQGFGASIGNAICPHNIVAANATVALTGREGEVLRRTLGVTLLYSVLGGVIALLLTTFS